jgi:hypothetical protein
MFSNGIRKHRNRQWRPPAPRERLRASSLRSHARQVLHLEPSA